MFSLSVSIVTDLSTLLVTLALVLVSHWFPSVLTFGDLQLKIVLTSYCISCHLILLSTFPAAFSPTLMIDVSTFSTLSCLCLLPSSCTVPNYWSQ